MVVINRIALSIFLIPLAVSAQQVPGDVPAPGGTAPTAGRGSPGGPAGGSFGGGRAPQPPLPFLIKRFDPALDSLIAADAKLDAIVTIPNLSAEGPMWRDGKLWFSDQRGGNIYAVAMDGKLTVIAENAGGPIDPAVRVNQGPNGEVTDKDGTVLVCRQGLRDIGRLGKDGTFSVVLAEFEGKRLNSPNDLVFAPNGTLWFTDPAFSVPGYRNLGGAPASPPADSQLPIQGVFRYKDGKLARVISDMTLPNGIGLSPDGKTLYVDTGSPTPNIRAYDIGPDDSLSNQRILSDYAEPGGGDTPRGAVDGLKIDSKGNVWATGPGGISVISPAGKMLGRIQLPTGSSNIAFGEDLHSIFFTSGSTIYRLHTVVAGEKPMYYRP